MNAPLRRAGVVVLVLFGLLFANLNWVQAYKADEYRTNDYNRRVVVAQYERDVLQHRGELAVRSEAWLQHARRVDQRDVRRSARRSEGQRMDGDLVTG